MRLNEFSVEVLPAGSGTMRELPNGQVLATAGQVYVLRLTNHADRRAVVDITMDGHAITAGGLVLGPRQTIDLERPVTDGEHGRFTVIREGNEAVFGDDGGRDNPDLGLIEVRVRRELPRALRPTSVPAPWVGPWLSPVYGEPPTPGQITFGGTVLNSTKRYAAEGAPRLMQSAFVDHVAADAAAADASPVVGGLSAAGTGLTGESAQRFHTVAVGALEPTPTVIRLRLVIGATLPPAAARPLPGVAVVPPRPAPRP